MLRSMNLSLGLIVVAWICGGCHSHQSALSPREGFQTTPLMLLSAYDGGGSVQVVPSPAFPIRVAVAQVGELAPPQAVLDAMSKHPVSAPF